MLILLSPAKSLDFETRVPAVVARRATEPQMTARAAELITLLRQKSPADVAALMDLSDALAALNVARYAAWQPQATPDNSKPAVLAFDGDVYGGLDAKSLKTADLDWAQQHVLILSGLYGLLRPLDRLQPYRLEMGSPLATPSGQNLYAYWGDTLACALNERLSEERPQVAAQASRPPGGLSQLGSGPSLAPERRPVIINLASQEYARAALRPSLKARVIHCRFEEGRPGRYTIVSFFAKRARGLMARWAIEQRVRRPEALQGFDREGYAFDGQASERDHWVFRRTISN